MGSSGPFLFVARGLSFARSRMQLWALVLPHLSDAYPSSWSGPLRQQSSVLNLVAAEEKYQIPSAKSSAELARRKRFLPQEA